MRDQLFLRQFTFNPAYAGWIGVEQEAFVACAKTGIIGPHAKRLLDCLANQEEVAAASSYGPELSACQIEWRTNQPTPSIQALQKTWWQSVVRLEEAAAETSLVLRYQPVGPSGMPLAVFPDPRRRYEQIAQSLTTAQLAAACRVAGLHVHIGMPDPDTALRVYNYVVQQTEALQHLLEQASAQRLTLYSRMQPTLLSPPFSSWDDLRVYAEVSGFVEDPRRWWSLVRISKHGTIEFRMFDSQPCSDTSIRWADVCLRLCQRALHT